MGDGGDDKSTQAEMGKGPLPPAPKGKAKQQAETKTERPGKAQERGADPKGFWAPVIAEREGKLFPQEEVAKEGAAKDPEEKKGEEKKAEEKKVGEKKTKEKKGKKSEKKADKKPEPPLFDALGRIRVMLDEAIKADIDPFEQTKIEFVDAPDVPVVDERQTVALFDYSLDPRKVHSGRQRIAFYDPVVKPESDLAETVLFDGETIETDLPVPPSYREVLFEGTVVNTMNNNDNDDRNGDRDVYVEDLFTEDNYTHRPNEDTMRINIQLAAIDFMSFSKNKWTGVDAVAKEKYGILEQYNLLSQINTTDLSVVNAARMHLAQTLFVTCLEDIPESLSI